MKLFFSVGEPSGDLHGANLIKALQARTSELEFVGYGGPKMKAAGCFLHEDLTEHAVMGFFRVLLYVFKFVGFMRRADHYFKNNRPDAVILIDFPGFNWWIAKKAKASGIPVFYYGTPQLWGWLPGRVKKMRKFVDHVLCKLPFEEKWYHDRDCNATFIGHPYYDELQNQKLDQSFIEQFQQSDRPLITILPGSRTHEVSSNLDAFLISAKLIQEQHPNVQFAIAAFKQPQVELIEKKVFDSGLSIPIYVNRTPELISAAHSCLACSGSVSLELLYREKPTVIHYKLTSSDHLFQRILRKVKYITLVNILWSKQPFFEKGEYFLFDPDNPEHEQVPYPEYLTTQDKTTHMARWICNWIEQPEEHLARVETLHQLKKQVTGAGASNKGADYILKHLNVASNLEELAKAA